MLLMIVVLLINVVTALIVLPHVAPIWSWVFGFAVLIIGGCVAFRRHAQGRIRVPADWPRNVWVLIAVTEFGVTGAKMVASPRILNERSPVLRRLQGLAILSSLASPIAILSWAMALFVTS